MDNGWDCLSVCMTNAEEHFNYGRKDYEVYFAFGSRRVTLLKKENCLISDSHGAIEDHLKEKGIKRLFENSFHGLEPEKFLQKCVNEKKAVIVSLKSNKLYYRSFFADNGIVDHYLLITDFSDERKIYVVDGYSPNEYDSGMEGWIDVDEILEAWKECRYMCFVIGGAVFADEQNNRQLADAVLDTAKSYLQGGEDEERAFGECAVRKWLKNINETNDIQHLIFQIKITGLLTIKQYLAEYLRHTEHNKDLADQYIQIINGWQKICLLLFQMNLRKKYNKFDYIREAGAELIQLEHTLLCKLIERDRGRE